MRSTKPRPRPRPLLSFLFLVLSLSLSSSISSLGSNPILAVHAHSLQYPVSGQYPLIARVGEPYVWSISSETFADTTLDEVKAVRLPKWLRYNTESGTLWGTPGKEDEGTVEVELVAGGDGDQGAKDVFTICVTRFPPPIRVIAIEDQLKQDNPALASVFTLHKYSALGAPSPSMSSGSGSNPAIRSRPAVRVPPNWSFSVGLQGGTYEPAKISSVEDSPPGQTVGDLFYYALREDGTPLPPWIKFNPDEMTFDGYTRSPPVIDPEVVPVALIATDQRGYSAYRDVFNIIVASQELSAAGPTIEAPINVTQGEDVDFDLRSGNSWVFDSVLVNNGSLNAGDITRITVDTIPLPWLGYESGTFRLSGTAPRTVNMQGTIIPLILNAFNQTLPLNVTIRVLPSYFSEPVFGSVYAAPGMEFSYTLESKHLSGSPEFTGHDVNLTALFQPSSAGSFLRFDYTSNSLSGTVPRDLEFPDVNVTFAAYDHTTHSSSHASLIVSFDLGSASGSSAISSGTPDGRKRKLILALAVTFGIIGGTLTILGLVACWRRYVGGRLSASGPRTKAYVIEPDVENNLNYAGWTERLGLGSRNRNREVGCAQGNDIMASDRACSPALATFSAHSTAPSIEASAVGQYTGLGIGFTPSQPSRMIKKKVFFEGVKNVVRRISAGSWRKRTWSKKEIGNPVLVLTRDSKGTLTSLQRVSGIGDESAIAISNVTPPSTGTTGTSFGLDPSFRSVNVTVDDSEQLSLGLGSSPSSAGQAGHSEKSIPRRRSDFGPPRTTLPVDVATPSVDIAAIAVTTAGSMSATDAVSRSQLPVVTPSTIVNNTGTKRDSRHYSTDTQHTQSSSGVEEAVIATASRAASVHSTHSSYSYIPSVRESMARPRLVQFTSAKGVPVPIAANFSGTEVRYNVHAKESAVSSVPGKRRISQVADIVETDDALLSEGMRYVRAFGGAENGSMPVASTSRRPSKRAGSANAEKVSPTMASNGSSSRTPLSTQSSYVYPSPSASFESELNYRGSLVTSRILVRVGESFSFKLPVNVSVPPPLPNGKGTARCNIVVRPLHGVGKTPTYLSYTPVSPKSTKASQRVEVEFWGIPGEEDVGELTLGVYNDKGDCVGKLAIEAVSRN